MHRITVDRRTLMAFLGMAPVVAMVPSKASTAPAPWFPSVQLVRGPHPNPASGYEWHCAMSMTCPVTGNHVYDMAVAVNMPDAETEAVYIAQLTNSLMMLMYRRMANLKETT